MSPARQVIVVGAGGFGRETAACIRAVNQAGSERWALLGFVDDDPALAGSSVDGLPVFGPIPAVLDHPDALIVVTIGTPRAFSMRRRIVMRLGLPAERYASIVHPSATLAAGSSVGPGTVLLAGVVVTAPVAIGAHVAMMPACVITHDDVVGDFSTLATGVRLGGGVVVGDGAYLGAGCLIREGVRIGAGALVGMGAVVLGDVGSGETWAGVPARRLRPAVAIN